MCETLDKFPFASEYITITSSKLGLSELISLCTSGGLRTSSFRSLVWRVLLKCLPEDRQEWCQILRRSRKTYASLKEKNIADPRDAAFSQDPQVNNPLAEGTQCPWTQYFADGELRDIIWKDVERTFPEMEFYQNLNVRQIMAHILLVFAKEYPYLSYKQGMHEILAPLVFVLFSDFRAYEHAIEIGELQILSEFDQKILRELNDDSFLEHDAYCLFSEVMREVCKWYEDGQTDTSADPMNPHPFQRIQDSAATSHLMGELIAIGDTMSNLDPQLQSHLCALDIPAQLYGIRWLRLLFGREFPMHDLLFLWDVIFSDRPIPRMVESIFAAMLVYIRDLLLQSDYGGCLQYLMRYPPVVDVLSFVQLSLHFRSPMKNPRPKMISMSNYAHLTVQGTLHPNTNTRRMDAGNLHESISIRRPSNPGRRPPRPMKSPKRQENPQTPSFEQELHVLEEQVAVLQQRLNERDIIASGSAKRIEEIARDLPLAVDQAVRQSLAARLREIGSSLGGGMVGMTNGQSDIGMVSQSGNGGPIEMAKEVMVRSGTPRISRNNEMREVRTSLLK